MNSDKEFTRLWKLQVSMNGLVLGGKRSARALANFLQKVIFETNLPWEEVYQMLGIKDELGFLDFCKKQVKAGEGLWYIPVLRGIAIEKVHDAIRDLGVIVRGPALRKLETKDTRSPDFVGSQSYMVTVRNNIEADECMKHLSASDLDLTQHMGVTFLEYSLLFLAYALFAGSPLDPDVLTICHGSRGPEGKVLVAGVNVIKELVYFWQSADSSGADLRSRKVHSITK